MGFVHIKHPDLEGTARVSERYLPHAIKRGWARADGPVEPSPGGPDPAENVPPTSKSTKDEWVAYAVAHGMNSDEANAATKADLAALYAPEGA